MSTRRRLPLRWRWAMWTAAAVTIAGLVAVVATVVLAGQLLRDRSTLPVTPRPPVPGAPRPPSDPPGALAREGRVVETTLADVRSIGLGIVGALAVASVGVGWLAAGWIIRPVRQLTDAAERITEPGSGERIDDTGPDDELTEMAATFNGMLDRLDAAFVAQKTFVSDASHELRTPLALMRTEVDVALDDPDPSVGELRSSLDEVRRAIDRAAGLVDSLLHLSRAEAVVDVAAHDLAEAARRAIAESDTSGVTLSTHVDPAPVTGDPLLLDRAVANLVHNAIRYNHPGGLLGVDTGTDATGSWVRVDNDGPVVADHEVPTLFERFRRRERSRSRSTGGAGLGLSIVQAVVTAHGGSVEAHPRPGGGLSVTVRLATRTNGDGVARRS